MLHDIWELSQQIVHILRREGEESMMDGGSQDERCHYCKEHLWGKIINLTVGSARVSLSLENKNVGTVILVKSYTGGWSCKFKKQQEGMRRKSQMKMSHTHKRLDFKLTWQQITCIWSLSKRIRWVWLPAWITSSKSLQLSQLYNDSLPTDGKPRIYQGEGSTNQCKLPVCNVQSSWICCHSHTFDTC